MKNAVNEHRYFASTTVDPVRRAKTICTSHVLAALGIDESEYRYSGTERQMMGIARRKWSCRSVKSRMGAKPTVGGIRQKLWKTSREDGEIVAYIVFVKGHVLLMGCSGHTICDTDPRDNDRRPVRSIYAVRNK